MPKIGENGRAVLEKHDFQNPSDLIGRERFGPKLEK
jgi:hypothetical protein